MQVSETADAVVVGGGTVGAWCAYFLRRSGLQRVVLIDFPIAGQKSIGFLTHTVSDSATGSPLAAVLVPQAINPSSAYLQFVPMHMVTETDLTMEQAMSMLLTGGAVCPDTIRYSNYDASATGTEPTAVVEVSR